MSGLASLMSRPILRITPMWSSLLSRLYLSSRAPGPRPVPCDALYVSSVALHRTTIRRCVSLSLVGMGACCSATSLGSSGGGIDCVPVRSSVASALSVVNIEEAGGHTCALLAPLGGVSGDRSFGGRVGVFGFKEGSHCDERICERCERSLCTSV